MSDPKKTGLPDVLYLSNDASLGHRIRPMLEAQGIKLCSVPSLDDCPTDCAGMTLGVLMLDTRLLVDDETVQDFIDGVSGQLGEPQHVIVIAHDKAIELRLQAMRAKAAAFFVAPVASAQLVEKLVNLVKPRAAVRGKVLVVDDSRLAVMVTDKVLREAGFEIRSLTDPLQVLDALETFAPDLVLLDLNMPEASGAELAAIIREHDAYGALPIVYLSNETDADKQVEALSMGGDAFITKPIRPDLLVRAVTQRIESAQTLRSRFGSTDHMDATTGMCTRRFFMTSLDRAVHDPSISEPGNGLFMIRLDGAGKLVEKVGPAGEHLVQDRIGRLLKTRLGEDSVSRDGSGDLLVRYDDASHVLLLRRQSMAELDMLGEDLRREIDVTDFEVDGELARVTVSIGIGYFNPSADDAVTMISRAEKACAKAMTNGGNRVAAYEPFVPGPEDGAHESRMGGLIDHALGDAEKAHFKLHYQPIVAMQQQDITYQDALLRLQAEDGELISFQDFTQVAERKGRTGEVDAWLLRHALDVMHEHRKRKPLLQLIVRQSLESLTVKGWVLDLRDQIIQRKLAKQRPVLEFDIHDVIEHLSVAEALNGVLRKLGVKLCVSGIYNQAAVLDTACKLQPALAKLSPDMVREAEASQLTWVVKRLTQAGSDVIAPGIEEPSRIGLVWNSGVRYVQGTFVQPPQGYVELSVGEVAIG